MVREHFQIVLLTKSHGNNKTVFFCSESKERDENILKCGGVIVPLYGKCVCGKCVECRTFDIITFHCGCMSAPKTNMNT